jgi:hypothetical protein
MRPGETRSQLHAPAVFRLRSRPVPIKMMLDEREGGVRLPASGRLVPKPCGRIPRPGETLREASLRRSWPSGCTSRPGQRAPRRIADRIRWPAGRTRRSSEDSRMSPSRFPRGRAGRPLRLPVSLCDGTPWRPGPRRRGWHSHVKRYRGLRNPAVREFRRGRVHSAAPINAYRCGPQSAGR